MKIKKTGFIKRVCFFVKLFGRYKKDGEPQLRLAKSVVHSQRGIFQFL